MRLDLESFGLYAVAVNASLLVEFASYLFPFPVLLLAVSLALCSTMKCSFVALLACVAGASAFVPATPRAMRRSVSFLTEI